MATTDLVAVRRKEEALASMNPELRKVCDRIAKTLEQTKTDVAKRFYEIGVMLRTVVSKRAVYGESTMERLADALSIDLSQLQDCRQVATAFKAEKFEKLIERRNALGNRITWTHIVQLSRLRDAPSEVRVEINRQTFNEGLSTRELGRRIQEHFDKPATHPDRRAGRKPTPPRSITAGLDEICRLARNLEARQSGYDAAVFSQLDSLGPGETTPQLQQKIQDALDAEKRLKDTVSLNCRRLSTAAERAGRFNRAATNGHAESSTKTAKKRTGKKKAAKKATKKKATKKKAAAVAA